MNSTKNLINNSNLLMECLKSEKLESGPMYGQFLIDSLSSGQGITIGNLLRRVLLGDLQGTAITGVRIAGVKDEFSLINSIIALNQIDSNMHIIIFTKQVPH